MKESEIERYLVRRVKELGGVIRKVSWIGVRGAPDRLVMLPSGGHNFWIELKATGVEPTKLQLDEHERMRELGENVVVADSIARVEVVLHYYARLT